jgi:energy-coupling factor transport system ATP-binding protein
MGPDGSGKTTLAKLISRRFLPDSGEITFELSPHGGRLPVGYLGGDPMDSLVGTSVEEDVAFGLENMRLPVSEMHERVRKALHATGLSGMEQRLTHTLSGGEQQKLALAALLALDARVLILDEALSMLDKPIRGSIRLLIGALQREHGLTVIEITNNVEEAANADRLLFMSKEGIGFDGPAEAFLSSRLGREWTRMGGGVPALLEALPEPAAAEVFRRDVHNIAKILVRKIRPKG